MFNDSHMEAYFYLDSGMAPLFFTSALDGSEWSASHPCRFIPLLIG
jgi:hypothetical protein